MRFSHALFHFLLPWSLVCCEKSEDSPEATSPNPLAEALSAGDTTGPGNGEPSIPLRYQSKEVLPGSRAELERDVRPGQTPRTLVHDTPTMDKYARGNYSYLGAAREFKAICGFQLPEWVEPLKGNYSVTVKGGGFVRQSWLEYKIDPARRAELERLISEANARQFPQRHPVEFVQSSSQPGTRVGFIDFKPDGEVKERMGATLEEDGTVTLRSSLGPVGWDE